MSISQDVATHGANGSDANLLDDGTGAPTGASCLSDTLNLLAIWQGFMIHAAGAIKVVTADGDTLALPACAVGVVIPIAIKKIFATGTVVSAANITLLGGKF